ARVPVALMLVSIVMLSSATPARADNVTVVLTVLAGSLTEVAGAAVVTAAAPGGTGNYTIPITVTDTRGTGVGWNMTITSTQFAPVSGSSSPPNASSLTSVAVAACLPTVCVTPTNSVTFPVAVPAGSGPPTALKFYNAASSTGTGVLTVT